ncbi:MAG: hypothetical protein C0622_02060 [Desulfuromonas sp.]|nr:MAG: hypothetical protein C0622_02060 [Desulfuromonas sp.]
MNKLLTFIAITLLLGCHTNLHQSYKVSDNYYVATIDTPGNRSLYYDLGNGNGAGRVNDGVVGIGWDKVHIIVRQNIATKDYYYILEINKDSKYADPSESVSGPLSKAKFHEMREKLKVDPALDFSKTWP